MSRTCFIRQQKNARRFQCGVVLIESLIAVLIFSIGILALVGVQATMIKSTNDAKYRADASFIAQQRVSLIWVNGDPTLYCNSEETDTDISSLLPDGRRTTVISVITYFPAVATNACPYTYVAPAVCAGNPDDPSCVLPSANFQTTVTWQQPGSTETHNFTTTGNVAGGG